MVPATAPELGPVIQDLVSFHTFLLRRRGIFVSFSLCSSFWDATEDGNM